MSSSLPTHFNEAGGLLDGTLVFAHVEVGFPLLFRVSQWARYWHLQQWTGLVLEDPDAVSLALSLAEVLADPEEVLALVTRGEEVRSRLSREGGRSTIYPEQR